MVSPSFIIAGTSAITVGCVCPLAQPRGGVCSCGNFSLLAHLFVAMVLTDRELSVPEIEIDVRTSKHALAQYTTCCRYVWRVDICDWLKDLVPLGSPVEEPLGHFEATAGGAWPLVD